MVLSFLGLMWVDLDPIPPTNDKNLIEKRLKELELKGNSIIDKSELN